MLNRFLLACSWCIDQLIPQIPRAEVVFVWKLLCTRKSGGLSEFGISRLEWLFGWNGHFSGPALRGWWGWHKWPQISLGLQEKIKNQWSWPWPTSRIKMFGISAENPWQSHVDSIVYSKATRLWGSTCSDPSWSLLQDTRTRSASSGRRSPPSCSAPATAVRIRGQAADVPTVVGERIFTNKWQLIDKHGPNSRFCRCIMMYQQSAWQRGNLATKTHISFPLQLLYVLHFPSLESLAIIYSS